MGERQQTVRTACCLTGSDTATLGSVDCANHQHEHIIRQGVTEAENQGELQGSGASLSAWRVFGVG